MAVLSQNHTDLSSMDKPEVSKSLFGLIQWEEILRSGVFLDHRDVSLFVEDILGHKIERTDRY